VGENTLLVDTTSSYMWDVGERQVGLATLYPEEVIHVQDDKMQVYSIEY